MKRERRPSAAQVALALEEGYSAEEAARGWIIAADPDDIDAIEKIDVMGFFNSDRQAANAAMRAGVRLINDMRGVRKNIYLDTKRNRRLLKQVYGLK